MLLCFSIQDSRLVQEPENTSWKANEPLEVWLMARGSEILEEVTAEQFQFLRAYIVPMSYKQDTKVNGQR
jgi:hypothetical protein